MRSQQTGITFWSFLVIASVAVIIGFAALKLTPVYLEYMRVRQVLDDVKRQFDGQEANVGMVQTAIAKRLEVDALGGTDVKDFKVSKTDSGIEVRAEYQRTVPYLGNLSILASFDRAVEITH